MNMSPRLIGLETIDSASLPEMQAQREREREWQREREGGGRRGGVFSAFQARPPLWVICLHVFYDGNASSTRFPSDTMSLCSSVIFSLRCYFVLLDVEGGRLESFRLKGGGGGGGWRGMGGGGGWYGVRKTAILYDTTIKRLNVRSHTDARTPHTHTHTPHARTQARTLERASILSVLCILKHCFRLSVFLSHVRMSFNF